MIDDQIKALEALKGKSVSAGWFSTARYVAGKGVPPKAVGMSIAAVARIQEFGANIKTKKGKIIIIPSRPFMRLAWRNFYSNRKAIQSNLADQMVKGKIKPEQALGQIGLVMEGYIAKSIKNGGWVANAPATIARKGFDKPLVHTGQMLKTISSKVEDENTS